MFKKKVCILFMFLLPFLIGCEKPEAEKKELDKQTNLFLQEVEIANSTSKIALQAPVSRLTHLLNKTEEIKVGKTCSYVKDNILWAMKGYREAIIGFMSGKESDYSAMLMLIHITQLKEALLHNCLSFNKKAEQDKKEALLREKREARLKKQKAEQAEKEARLKKENEARLKEQKELAETKAKKIILLGLEKAKTDLNSNRVLIEDNILIDLEKTKKDLLVQDLKKTMATKNYTDNFNTLKQCYVKNKAKLSLSEITSNPLHENIDICSKSDFNIDRDIKKLQNALDNKENIKKWTNIFLEQEIKIKVSAIIKVTEKKVCYEITNNSPFNIKSIELTPKKDLQVLPFSSDGKLRFDMYGLNSGKSINVCSKGFMYGRFKPEYLSGNKLRAYRKARKSGELKLIKTEYVNGFYALYPVQPIINFC